MYLAFLFILTALFAHTTWRRPVDGLVLLAAALPTYLLRFNVGLLPMTLLETLVLVLFGVWLIQTKTHPRHWLPTRWRLSALLLLLAASTAVLVAPDTLAALGLWKAYFVEPILVFIVATHVLAGSERRIVNALGMSAAFVAVCGIIQSLTGWGLPAPWDVEGRITSIYPYPNSVGLFLGPIVVLGSFACIHAWNEKRQRAAIAWFAAIILSIAAIALAQSEATYVALAATFVLIGLTVKKLRILTITLVVLTSAIILLSPLRQTVFTKLTLHDASGEVRRSQWTETVELLKDHPFVGAGLSGYPTALEPYHTHTQYEIFQYPHNIILNIWTELGLLGLLAFALLAYQILNHSTTPSLHDSTTLPAFFALLEITIHGLVDVPYFKNDLAILTWLLIALLYVSSRPSAPATQS